MKKILLFLSVLFLSWQANANEIEKTGRIYLDNSYVLELTYLSETDEIQIINSKSTYTCEEQDCRVIHPAKCTTFVNFAVGSVKVRILDMKLEKSKQELFNQILSLKGSSSFEKNPIAQNQCDETLPLNHQYYVYLGISDIHFTHNNKDFDLSVNINGMPVVVKNGDTQSALLNLTTVGGWANVGAQKMRWGTELHTADEWIAIEEDAKKFQEPLEPRQ